MRGVDGQGHRIAHGRTSGAVVATTRTFGSGRYEVRMRFPESPGFVVGMWTLHYSEVTEDPWFGPPRTRVRNHEIDIEIVHETQGRSELWFSTAVGVEHDAKTTERYRVAGLAGEFHVLSFDWHSGPDPHVHFELDGRRMTTIHTHVPTLAGRVWLGAWAPRGWGGDAAFSSRALEVDWVRLWESPAPADEQAEQSEEGFLWEPLPAGTAVPW